MPVILDLSQIILAPIHVPSDAQECAKNPSEDSKKLIKHFILNSIRAHNVQHKQKYGKLHLACDYGSWRRGVFSQYKWARREGKKNEVTEINWSFVSEVANELIQDIHDYFPIPIIKVPKTEGDDIIGVLVKHWVENPSAKDTDIFGEADPDPILIVSSDGDNAQLRKWSNVKQFSPIEKKLITLKDTPRKLLIEKIVKGDSGDGVMNIRMPDNTFVDGVRQKPISQKLLDAFFDAKDPIDACTDDEMRKNFLRNEQLVSYEKIPQHIVDKIMVEYHSQVNKKHDSNKLINYFVSNKMGNLYSNIHDFY